MLNAHLIQDTSDAEPAQALLAELLKYAAMTDAQALEILVPEAPRPSVMLRITAHTEVTATTAESKLLHEHAQTVAQGRLLHAVVRNGSARLWLQAHKGIPAIAWRAPPRVARRHPLLPAWWAMKDGSDLLLGLAEATAHGRLFQTACINSVPALRRLAESFVARPARLWRRGQEGIVLYTPGPQGETMADRFEVVLLPVPDAGPAPSETRNISQ